MKALANSSLKLDMIIHLGPPIKDFENFRGATSLPLRLVKSQLQEMLEYVIDYAFLFFRESIQITFESFK